MMRATFLCLLCCLSFTVTQLAASPSQPSAPIQIIYTLDGTTLSTYNIDPLTLQPTLAGTFTVETSLYGWIDPSPNGHFLYFVASNGNQSSPQLFVYATDASGVPQLPAVQKLSVNGFGGLQIDPAGHFLYMANYAADGSYDTLYILRRYLVDLNTGKISQPLVEAKYVLPNFDADSCGLFLNGFNSAGTTMYDGVFCATHEGPQSTYYERTLNPQTGALGPDTQVFAWSLPNGGSESVSFVKNLVFNFAVADDWQQGIGSVNVYPLVPNTNTPLLQCTATMLEACGYGGAMIVHPSGEYVFMDIGVEQVEKVDLNSKTITDTSYYIPYPLGAFSPDGSLVYAVNLSSSGFYIEIYGFNVSTGAVTPGQYIYVPQQIDNWLPAERY
jgi:hypothetical protein